MTSRCCVFTASILSGLVVGAHGHLRAERVLPARVKGAAYASNPQKTVNAPEPEIVFGKESKVHVITVSAGAMDSGRHKRLRGPHGWDYSVLNAGAGMRWKGFVSKPELLLKGLAEIPDDDVAVYVDSDSMYSGCQVQDFLARFTKICHVTGAKVVAGAEFNCAENGDCTTFPYPYREDVLRAFHTSAKAIDAWGLESARPRGDYVGAPGCNFPGCSLKYLNSGFFAAKARDLRWFARQWLDYFEKNITYGDHVVGDQARASAVMRNHPKEIVLDYAGVLVNSLYGNRHIWKKTDNQSQPMFEFHVDRKSWVNTVLGIDACFFHGNGNSDLPWLNNTILNQLRQRRLSE